MRRQNPLLQQVRGESQLRYGQPLSDILGARHTAHHQYQNDVATAEAVGQATKRAARNSIPQLAAIFNAADRSTKDATHQIELAAGGSSPAGVLALALKGEAGAAQAKIASAKAMAQADAVSRASDAVAGVAYAKKNALANYRDTRAGLMTQTHDLHAQAGAFAQSRLSDLLSQQQSEQQSQANSDRSYNLQVAKALHVNPLTGKPLSRTQTRTPSEQRQINNTTATARDAIGTARTWIQRLGQGNSLQKAVGILKTGGSIPVPTGQTDAQGQPKVHYMKVPQIAGDFVRAAVELEGKGYLSQTTVHTLRMRNVHVPKAWMTPPTPGAAGQKLSGSLLQGTRKIAGAIRLKG